MRSKVYAAALIGIGVPLIVALTLRDDSAGPASPNGSPPPALPDATAHADVAGAVRLPVSSREASSEASAPIGGVLPTALPAASRMLVVLGDSLSDTGNAAAVADFLLGTPMYPEPTIGLCNAVERLLLDRDCVDLLYRRSRVTNGPVAVELLAMSLGDEGFAPSFHTVPNRPVIGTNYAVAGAKARGERPQDLEHQLDRLLLDRGPLLPAGAVVVVMIGGNDAIDALQAAALPNTADPADGIAEPQNELPDGVEAADEGPPGDPSAGQGEAGDILAAAVAAIGEAAVRLLDHGASCVIVANVPDLALLPAVRDAAMDLGLEEAVAERAATETALRFNEALDMRLDEVELAHSGGASLVRFDFAAALMAAAAEAETDGIDLRDACFDSELYAGSPDGERRFDPNCAPAAGQPPRFDRFFFWDSIHPTAQVHAALGETLAERTRLCSPAESE